MSKTPPRKRPCRICRRWFLPNPRLKDRQMTCGQVQCQRKWHLRKCAEWNSKNSDYFKANYLQKKIDAAIEARGDPEMIHSKLPTIRMQTGMPLEYVKELIGVQHVIIHEYLGQLLNRKWHKKWRIILSTLGQATPTRPPKVFSRGDKNLTSCNH